MRNLSKSPIIRALIVFAASVAFAGQALATTNVFSLGVNFGSDQLVWDFAAGAVGGTSDLAPGDLAGIPGFQQKNWNNVVDEVAGGYPNGTASNLTADDKGTAKPTTAQVVWVSNGTWSTSGSRGATENNGTNFFPNTPDNKLLTGYLDTGNATTTTVTFTNLPNELLTGGYNVLVYGLNGAVNANRGGSVRVVDAATGVPLTAYKLITSPTPNRPTAYVEDLGVNHTDTGIYLRFNSLVASSIRIESTTTVNPNNGTPRAPVSAVQLVAAGLTEPVLNGVSGTGQGFSFSFSDLPGATLDVTSVTVKLDGASTNLPVVVGAKAGGLTPVTYDVYADKKVFFASGSTHTNVIGYKDGTGKAYTATRTFTVPAYTTINSAFAVASADTSKPGFRLKVHQMDVNRNPGTGVVPNAERQIAGGYIDPASGQPYGNTADLSAAGPDGFIIESGTINYNQDAPTATGSFSSASVPPQEDKLVPGIGAGTANATDRYVFSIETFLDLKAGLYRFGVNSDDGFRLSFGRGPGDVIGTQLATAGDRGVADTTVDVVIPVDGFYPVRVMWWETGGGSACEFFAVNIATGVKTLINDSTSPASIKAYRESAVARPYVSRVLPTVNYTYAFADQDLLVDITDGASAIDQASIRLLLNNAAVTVTPTKSGKVTTIQKPGSLSNLLGSGPNNVSVIYSFTEGGSTVTVTNSYAFTVPAYTRPIPPANKVLASQVSGSGFHVNKAVQIDRSKDLNQGNGGRHTGNNMPGPEIELIDGYIDPLTGNPFPNLMDFSAANPDKSFDVLDVLNANHSTTTGQAANSGLFNIDVNLSGLPGTGSSNLGLDNTVHEYSTYLDLKAGTYIFGLNVDDGWVASSAPNPRDTLGTLLGFKNAPGGNAGSPLAYPNAAFSVIVPEDGIYPFRILYWEGGGGVNLEFLSVDKQTGSHILVNDQGGSFPSVVALSGQLNSPIKAYNTYSGPVRPWVKFSVYPMPYIGVTTPLLSGGTAVTLWQNRDQQSGPGPITRKLGLLNGSWNSGEVWNSSTSQRPFGDSVGAIVADLGSGTVGMVLDGVSVTPTVTSVPNSNDKLVLYTPPTPLSSSSNHIAGLVYGGTTNYWIFSVITYVTVAATDALPSSAADQSARGFLAKVTQGAAARAAGNTAAAAETQLAGTPANVAKPGPNADGSYTVPGIINWNVAKAPGFATPTEVGNFQPLMGGPADDAVPGIPGTGLASGVAASYENITAEIFAYLDLPAGYQKFGVNGDDGWKVQIGVPGQTNGLVLFTTDRGAGAQDIPFAFITPQAGLYPVRLVWYQGGGGGNVEFFTYGPNNTKIPVNGTDPNAVKAYSKATGGGGTKPTLAIAAGSGGNLSITYTGTLQFTDSLSPINWQNVAGATSPFSVAPSGGQRYYRAVNP